MLLSTHVLADVENLVDRVGLLSRGRLALEDPAETLLAASVREVVINGEGPLPEDLLQGIAGSERRGTLDGWTLSLPHPGPLQVDGCLRRVLRAGAVIHGLETRRDDLERVFTDRLRREEQA
jgi:ABC-type multidrug transport system ATPase subunit